MTTGPQGRIYDEFAKLLNDAAGLAQSAGREVTSAMRAQGERVASQLDLVRREDLDVVQEIAAKALAEVERLSARVAELEARLPPTETPPSDATKADDNP